MLIAALLPSLFEDASEERNDRFNAIQRKFLPTNRYIVDGADDLSNEGWMQFDTDQDASYFGVWVNPTRMQVLTYAEGDWSLISCSSPDRYNEEVTILCECYDEGYEFIAYDIKTGTRTVSRQDRKQFYKKEAA